MMWKDLYQICWAVIILNAVVDMILMVGMGVVYPPVIEWVGMIVPLCCFGYVVGFWAFEKTRVWQRRRERVLARKEVLTQRGLM